MFAPEAFWNRMAYRYAKTPVADEEAYQTKLAATRRLLRPDMEVFEFGCGTGLTAITHAPYARRIRGMDFSERMIDIARDRARTAGIDNVAFEVGSIESVDLPENSLDMIMGHSILHLLKDKRAAIEKSFRALRPGGFFVTSTACLGEMLPAIRFVAPLGSFLGLLPHLDVMTPAQLRAEMARAGFTIEHDWQPSKKAALFLIARKPEPPALSQL